MFLGSLPDKELCFNVFLVKLGLAGPAQVCILIGALSAAQANCPRTLQLTVQLPNYIFGSPRICQRRRLSSNPSCSIETVTVVLLLIEGHDFKHLCRTSITGSQQKWWEYHYPSFRLTESSNKTECIAPKNTIQRSKWRTWRISIMSMCKRIKANWTSKHQRKCDLVHDSDTRI